jgi:hypothetical protein
MNEVRRELEDLAKQAKAHGHDELAKEFEKQLSQVSGAGMKRRKMMGGQRTPEEKCRTLTTAMFMSAGAAISVIAYLHVWPSVLKMTAVPCKGLMDRTLSFSLGWADERLSCTNRQIAWSSFVRDTMLAALGVKAVEGSAIGTAVKDLFGLENLPQRAYNKVYEYNMRTICSKVFAMEKAIEEGKCDMPAKSKSASSTRKSSSSARASSKRSMSRKVAAPKKKASRGFFESMFGFAGSDSEAESSASPSKSPKSIASKSASRRGVTKSVSRPRSASAKSRSQSMERATRKNISKSPSGARQADIRKFMGPATKRARVSSNRSAPKSAARSMSK